MLQFFVQMPSYMPLPWRDSLSTPVCGAGRTSGRDERGRTRRNGSFYAIAQRLQIFVPSLYLIDSNGREASLKLASNALKAKRLRPIQAWLKTQVRRAASWSHRHHLVEAAATVLVSLIFFASHDSQARLVFVAVLLPLAGLGCFSQAWHDFRFSTVLAGCVGYMLAMLVASTADAESLNHDVWVQFYLSVYVFVFLVTIAALVASHRQFIARFFFFAGSAAAASAALNIYFFLEEIVPAGVPFHQYRLLTTIGMPAYANSTNISATYAVFFIGVLAVLVRGGLAAPMRAFLCLPAGLLLCGVLLAQARSGYAAVAVGLAVLALTGSARTRQAMLVAFALCAVAVLTIPEIRQAVLERGFSDRPEVWAKFLDLIAERPWIGYGSFNPIGIVVADKFLDQAHNLVLSAWFRGGVGSALAMAFILVGGLYWAWRCWLEVGQAVPLCVMVTITTASMVDYQLLATTPTWPWVTFWLPFGLCAGAEIVARKARESGSAASPPEPIARGL